MSESKNKLFKEFPRIMFVMIPVQLVQAFSLNVIMSIKAIFLTSELGYDEDTAVMINHIFISFEPIANLTGAILADSYFGKWKIIVAGCLLMRIPDVFFILSTLPNMPNKTMFLTAIASATFLNIHTATLSAFYSEQFRMPDHEKLLKLYYNIIYWGRNAVSVLGAFSGSRLAELQCLRQNNCYLAPFAVWVGTEILVAIIIMSLGIFFEKKPPTETVIFNFLSCVVHAISNKIRFGKEERRDRWIDHADDIFTDEFRDDVFTMVNMTYFFMLGILYWSLYDQSYSRFIYQGAKLDGQLTKNFRVYPGDTTILNPILVIILLPLVEYVLYPVCKKMKLLRTELQKVGTSEYLIATAFVAAALLEWQIRSNKIFPPENGHGHVIIFNGIDKAVTISGDGLATVRIEAYKSFIFKDISVKTSRTININITPLNLSYPLQVLEKQGITYILTSNNLELIKGYENYSKNKKSYEGSKIRCVCTVAPCSKLSLMRKDLIVTTLSCDLPSQASDYTIIRDGDYSANKIYNNIKSGFSVQNHMAYTFVVFQDNIGILFISNPHYLIPFYWIIPQILILTLGEVMHAIPWRLFIYTQSPPPMRSVVFALDLLSRSLGDLLVAIIAFTSGLEQLYEYILYAGLMYTVGILFTVLAIRYKLNQSRE